MLNIDLPEAATAHSAARSHFAYLLGLFAVMPIVQVYGVSVFLLLVYGYLLYAIATRRLRINLHSKFTPVFFAICASAVSSIFLSLPTGYFVNNIKGILNIMAIYLLASSMESDEDEAGAGCRSMLTAVSDGCKIQIVWIVMQSVCWRFYQLDINNILFNEFFGMVETASQYKATGYVPTGLCWNAGGIAPALILGFFLQKKMIWKIGVLIAAFLTQSLTLIIGTMLAVVLTLVFCPKKGISLSDLLSDRKKAIIASALVLLFIMVAVCNAGVITDGFLRIWDIFSYRISGLLAGGSNMDSSTAAHLGYLVNIPLLICTSPFMAVLLGYGVNCSGFHYSRIVGQYPSETWILECDPSNIILNYGIVGFVLYYVWLFKGLASLKNSKCLCSAFLILIVMGITYNMQYVWVILLEILIFDFHADEIKNRFGDLEEDISMGDHI